MQTLAEDLLLLALDDDQGTVSWRQTGMLPYGLGGALLMDLALQERIDQEGQKIVLRDPSPTGDEVLDAALEAIGSARRRQNAQHWIEKLGGQKGLKEHLARRLVARGILREQEHRFLWAFHDRRYPTNDPGPESALRRQIRDVVLGGDEPDTRTLLLLSLVHACKLTESLFTGEERRQAQQRMKELVEGEQFGKAVSGAIATAAAVAASIATVAAVAGTVSARSG